MPQIILESLDNTVRYEQVSIEELRQAGEGNECLFAAILRVKHPDGTQEDLHRFYGFHRLTCGVAGQRVYRELSPLATLRVLRGEVCAAHWAHPKAPCVCDRRPLSPPHVPQPRGDTDEVLQ